MTLMRLSASGVGPRPWYAKVPDVTGMTEADAIEAYRTAGFRVIVARAENSGEPDGTILAQQPAADSYVQRRARLTIVIAADDPRAPAASPALSDVARTVSRIDADLETVGEDVTAAREDLAAIRDGVEVIRAWVESQPKSRTASAT